MELANPLVLIEKLSSIINGATPTGFRGTQRGQRLNHRRIAACPVHQGALVRGPAESPCLTGPLNRTAALRDQVGHDLPPLNRPLTFFASPSVSAACSNALSA